MTPAGSANNVFIPVNFVVLQRSPMCFRGGKNCRKAPDIFFRGQRSRGIFFTTDFIFQTDDEN